MSGQPMIDPDRLPWLEPYREPAKPAPAAKKPAPAPQQVAKAPDPAPLPPAAPAPRRAAARPRPVFSTIGSTLAIAGAAALALAGYIVGRETKPETAPSGVSAALPAGPTKVLAYPTIGDEASLSAPTPAPAPETPQPLAPPIARLTKATPAREAARVAPPPPPAPPLPKAVVKPVAQAAPAPIPVTPYIAPAPVPPAAITPPPVAPRIQAPARIAPKGTVALLGYYVSQPHAEAGFRRAKRRYPYVGRLGRSVAPMVLGGHTVYALRLAAGNGTNAKTLCNYLHRTGTACAVE
ncbi:hypothetical protein ABDK56_05330 [Sphingomonas sp. ASV193]|uniref:hypothetical protein n=1 Tax=Sphingomonas sp. ASV193 TaxID=3144405 RepID=UPI0032E89BFF